MKYIVLHREQVTLELQSEIFTDYEEARKRQFDLRHQYHDVVILSEQDLLELKLDVNINVSKAV